VPPQVAPRLPTAAVEGSPGGQNGQSPGGSPDVDPAALASRLDLWMQSGCDRRRGVDQKRPSVGSSAASSDGQDYHADHSHMSSACSSRSSSSAPPHVRPQSADSAGGDGKQQQRGMSERRISLPEDAPQPKPTSDMFKAKRAKHYNEVAALKAFKWKPGDESASSSDTSDEAGAQTKTNTNTNINQTVGKAGSASMDQSANCSRRPSNQSSAAGDFDVPPVSGSSAARLAGLEPADAGEVSMDLRGAVNNLRPPAESTLADDPDLPIGMSAMDSGGTAMDEADVPPGSRASGRRPGSRGSVSFSGGESGQESSEEFRDLRRHHYAHEWKPDPAVPASVSSLETNTNTNLNAGRGAAKPSHSDRNPMEAGRPHVRVAADEGEPERERASQDFVRHRHSHYDEVEAVRRFRQEHQEELRVDADESSDDEANPVLQVGGSASSKAVGGVGNPMEPRMAGVAFQVSATSDSSGGSPQALQTSSAAGAADAVQRPGGGAAGPAGGDNARADWRAKRNAHYNEMAAALRAGPPPSSDEEDSSEAG